MPTITTKEELQCLVGIMRHHKKDDTLSLRGQDYLEECEGILMDLLIKEQITKVEIKDLKERKG